VSNQLTISGFIWLRDSQVESMLMQLVFIHPLLTVMLLRALVAEASQHSLLALKFSSKVLKRFLPGHLHHPRFLQAKPAYPQTWATNRIALQVKEC
jgi:hypothetical protein